MTTRAIFLCYDALTHSKNLICFEFTKRQIIFKPKILLKNKPTNLFLFCLTVLKTYSFVCFWKNSRIPKSPFEINRPLASSKKIKFPMRQTITPLKKIAIDIRHDKERLMRLIAAPRSLKKNTIPFFFIPRNRP